mmetsp:Transcript_16249/g.35750  ORF Transcript_16249/g.35750 Transcript_16249/m.35750 type:complete len:236 (+) Transcript_16249:1373-2080(+)
MIHKARTALCIFQENCHVQRRDLQRGTSHLSFCRGLQVAVHLNQSCNQVIGMTQYRQVHQSEVRPNFQLFLCSEIIRCVDFANTANLGAYSEEKQLFYHHNISSKACQVYGLGWQHHTAVPHGHRPPHRLRGLGTRVEQQPDRLTASNLRCKQQRCGRFLVKACIRAGCFIQELKIDVAGTPIGDIVLSPEMRDDFQEIIQGIGKARGTNDQLHLVSQQFVQAFLCGPGVAQQPG